jgi:hypothetical protein
MVRRLVTDPYASQILHGLGYRILSEILVPNLVARGI